MHISIAEPGGPTMRWLMSVFFFKVSFIFYFFEVLSLVAASLV
jgi:hypothetical protein